jgi:hypothetical protein
MSSQESLLTSLLLVVLLKGILDKAKEEINISNASIIKAVNNAFCFCNNIIDKQSGNKCEPKSVYAKI